MMKLMRWLSAHIPHVRPMVSDVMMMYPVPFSVCDNTVSRNNRIDVGRKATAATATVTVKDNKSVLCDMSLLKSKVTAQKRMA